MAEVLALIIVGGGLIPAALFPLLYGLSAPWWRSGVGRALMSQAVALFLLFVQSFIANAGVGMPLWVNYTAGALVVIGLWYVLIAYLHERRRIKKENA